MPRSLSFLFLIPLLLVPAHVQADPVVPELTIIGGTITGGRVFGANSGIVFNLVAVDPATGNIFNISGGGEGGFSPDPAIAGPGVSVNFSASISGGLDLGFGNVTVNFVGGGPPIPNVIQPNLDLQGTGTVSINGTFFDNTPGIGNPLFTVNQSISGPVTLHFIWLQPDDPRFELKTITLTVPEPVPEPASVILLLTSLGGLRLWRRRKGD